MIIDFDVHHGNGTQDAFYGDDTASTPPCIRLSPIRVQVWRKRGVGKRGIYGEFSCAARQRDAELLDIYENDLPPFVRAFKPDIILVSAGYDLHESDPFAQLNVTTKGIRKIVRSILQSADVPFLFFLEGGYDVNALGENVKVTLEEMLTIDTF